MRAAHLPQRVSSVLLETPPGLPLQVAECALVYSIFECLASTELGHMRRLDLDFLASARVASGARRALADLESAKTHQRHARAFFQRALDRAQRAVERLLGGRLGYIGRFRDSLNQFRFIHVNPL